MCIHTHIYGYVKSNSLHYIHIILYCTFYTSAKAYVHIYSYMALCNKPPSSHCFATWNGTGCQAAMQSPKTISGSQHFFLKKLIPDYCNTYPSYSKRWKRTKVVRTDRLTCPGTEIAPVLLAWLMWFPPTPLEYHKFQTNAYWNIYFFSWFLLISWKTRLLISRAAIAGWCLLM